jgi:glycosyltransferase involved in cell wall biosynthesis
VNARPHHQRVSVVVPAYNAAATVAGTLASLLAQSHREWEAIVVDDGSSDETAKRAAEAAQHDPRVRVIRQQNGGKSAARNSGVAHSQFDWLLFLDAGDWIAPDHLEKMTAQLEADSSLDAVHCRHARVAADGTEVVERYQPPVGDLFPILARRAAFPVHACVVRKAIVEEVGLFDLSLRISADWDLWQRVARTGANFGAVREVLAFYRMSPQGASLDGNQLFTEGMRVLRQGVCPDARVPRPHPTHAQGLIDQPVVTQEFYLLTWCAALLLGAGKDARPLLSRVGTDRFSELYPDAVAECVFEAAPFPTCQPPHAWEILWPKLQSPIDEFLELLEQQAQAPGLARRAASVLRQMILAASPTWSLVADAISDMNERFDQERRSWHQLAEQRDRDLNEQRERIERLAERQAALGIERTRWQSVAEEDERAVVESRQLIDQLNQSKELLEADRTTWQRIAAERERSIAHLLQQLDHTKAALEEERTTWRDLADEQRATISRQAASIETLQREKAILEEARLHMQQGRTDLDAQLHERTLERDRLRQSTEARLGDLILNRLQLRSAFNATERFAGSLAQRVSVARLAGERLLSRRPRVIATACDVFPIYSQTFVYQELTQLAQNGFDLRFVYSKLDDKDYLQAQFATLWDQKRRLFLSPQVHEQDFAHYRRRMPSKVDRLIDLLSEASGLSRDSLLTHGNVLQAFSFTRMVEAYRPVYLHSYFFYDRSLMALIAGYLLDIPRGVSCYADHLLQDYELKLVPLHLSLCEIVVATSERIKQELLQLAPHADASRILVKPNGIDSDRFPIMERAEPAEATPFRLITLCRIEPKKGLLDLVEAVSLLRRRGHPVEAHIVGSVDEWSQASRDYKVKLDQRITELDLWGKVHLEGRQNLDGILRFLRIAHLFVAPFVETQSGDKDGIPTALLEGMSTGLATVATTAGSITEVISDGHNGLLVPQRDAPSLANAVEGLLMDPLRRHELGKRAAESVRQRFDVRGCEQIFHERLRQVLAVERP